MTKHIAFVAPFGLGQKTTVWARTLPLAKQLVAHGHQVVIIIPPWDTPADSGRTWTEDGVALVNVRLNGGLPFVVGRLIAALNHFAPDIVHIVKPRAHAGIVQWLLWQRRKLIRNGPQIFLDVDDWEQAWATINDYPWLVARFLAWQEEWGIRHADGITAASHWLVDWVKQYSPATPVCYLPNGVTAPPATKPQPAVASQQILFYSRYVEVSPGWLAEFWAALHEAEPAATLVVFGDAFQPARPALFQVAMTARDPGAAARVSWQPYDQKRVESIYATSGCVIFPSDQTPLHEAKCSVRLATTLLRGIPVVASAVGEQQYYGAEGAAALVPAAATPAAFAAAVVQVLHDPETRKLAQQQARARILRDYDPVQLGSELARTYSVL
ncbi:MAG: glycosyltransferase family 4 protein [Caldilineaceae bacterium]